MSINFAVSPDGFTSQVMTTLFNPRRRPRYALVTAEELLLRLMEQPEVCEGLAAWGGDLLAIRDAVQAFLDQNIPQASTPLPRPEELEADALPANTPVFERVIQQAVQTVQYDIKAQPQRRLTGMDLLFALLSLPPEQCCATQIALRHGVKPSVLTPRVRRAWIEKSYTPPPEPVAEAIAQATSVPSNPYATPAKAGAHPGRLTHPIFVADRTETLRHWSLAERRPREEEALLRALLCRDELGAMVVGDPGVGKTHLATQVLARIARQDAPAGLLGHTIVELNSIAVVSGTQLRGDLEKRLAELHHWCQSHPRTVLWLDDLNPWMQLLNQGQGDVLGLLTELLRGTPVRLVATCPADKLKLLTEKVPAFVQHMHRITLEEPSRALTEAIVAHHAEHYGSHHGVRYAPQALSQLVRLAERHLPHQRFPAKALRLLDRAGAQHALLPADQQTGWVNGAMMAPLVAQEAGLPEDHLSLDDRQLLRELPDRLRAQVVHHTHAIDRLCDAIRSAKMGLGEGGKTRPLGNFLFMGPTGVGKTELAKQLAHHLQVPLIRLDMAEFQEPHSVSSLVGAPPGYVGFQQVGRLTGPLAKHPHAVLLCDEVEKAHPNVHQLLLSLLDEGHITDQTGQRHDGRHLIIIMTSNVGAGEAARPSLGWGNAPDERGALRQTQALEQRFSPEFLNRFDAILPFEALPRSSMDQLVRRRLERLTAEVAEQAYGLTISPAVHQWLADEGMNPRQGARALQRIITEQLTHPLARWMLEHPEPQGIAVDRQGEQLQFTGIV